MSKHRVRLAVMLWATLLLLGACGDKGPATLIPTAAVPEADGAAAGLAALATRTSTATLTLTATPSLTPTPTATPTATATPTPLPSALLTQAERELEYGDHAAALLTFQRAQETTGVTADEARAAMLGIAQAQLRAGAFAQAAETLDAFRRQYPGAPELARATFWLAQARQGQMDWAGSIEAFEAYLTLDDTLLTYVSDIIADSYLALGDHAAAIAAYETALTGAATTEKVIALRERLAQAYMAAGELEAAIAQYDAVPYLTSNSATLARMDYLAGYALIISGQPDQGYARYLHAVATYPAAYDSYLALIELIDAGYPVDDFQRGLVDYHAGATIPAISAFYRHMETNLYDHTADGHLYVARCYVALGNYAAALAELDVLIETHPGDPLWDDGWLEKAKVQVQWGDIEAAVETYLALADNYPASPRAPNALWRAAALRENAEAWEAARALYRRLAVDYPAHEDAAEALFRAGLMALRAGLAGEAAQDWAELVAGYPASDWRPPALLWLTLTLPPEQAADYRASIAALPPDSYYAIRAADLVSGVLPFEPAESVAWPQDETVDRIEAEAWLRGWLGLSPDTPLDRPVDALALDSRWARGRELWELGLREEARAELNSLRSDLADDAAASYQLALAFREMDLYRSSILAAAALIELAPVATPLEVPVFLARLAYPAPYRDLIEQAAADYGLDPLLLLAMIRQESLFESSARSWAAAQGLMQVIPSTGEYIAQQLGWPGYRNEDLFKPYVSIQFGAFYIAEQLTRFDGDPYAALAAYNGGPGNAARWLQVAPDNPDLFLEVITLSETRRYLQRIYSHYTFYRALYGADSADNRP